GEGDRTTPEPIGTVDPHLVGRGDQHVGRLWIVEQWLQPPRTCEFPTQLPDCLKHIGVSGDSTRFRTDRTGNGGSVGGRAVDGQSVTNPVDEFGIRHTARSTVRFGNSASAARATAASEPRVRPAYSPRSSARDTPFSCRSVPNSGNCSASARSTSYKPSGPETLPTTRNTFRSAYSSSRATTRAAAAHARTSLGTTIRTASAAPTATRAAGPIARSRSHTTISPDRLPASITDRTASGAGPPPLRPHDNTDNRPEPISASGNAACRSDIATRPEFTTRPGHRSPSRRSRPNRRSRPPPSASQSTSVVDAPALAARPAPAPANTDLPAPPRAPITASTAPCASLRSSTSSASNDTSSVSLSGNTITRRMPLVNALSQTS